MSNEIIELGHEGIMNETEEAVLFKFEIDIFRWIPKSQIDEYDEDIVSIPLWLAETKEIEVYEI